MKRRFGNGAALEAKLKKLFFISARQKIAETLQGKGIPVEHGFVNWYAGHMWDSSKESMLKMNDALKKWEAIKRMRRR